jgi:hypothetical protein
VEIALSLSSPTSRSLQSLPIANIPGLVRRIKPFFKLFDLFSRNPASGRDYGRLPPSRSSASLWRGEISGRRWVHVLACGFTLIFGRGPPRRAPWGYECARSAWSAGCSRRRIQAVRRNFGENRDVGHAGKGLHGNGRKRIEQVDRIAHALGESSPDAVPGRRLIRPIYLVRHPDKHVSPVSCTTASFFVHSGG